MVTEPNDAVMTVLVTGIGGAGHGEQILKALRLGQINYRIVGTDITDQCANRRLVDAFERVPRAGEPNYLETIFTLVDRYRARAVFHGSEPEMQVLSRTREQFAARGVYVPVNPPAVLDLCTDKAKTVAFLRQQGFRTPHSREVTKVADLEGFDTLPAVLKPSIGGGGSANVFIVQSRAELETFSAYLLRIYDRFLVQEYMGTPEDEYTVGVLFGMDGELLNSIAVKRVIGTALTVRVSVANRTGRSDLGSTLVVSSGISQGIVGRWPRVAKPCEAIACALRPTAPINIQCRLVGEDVVPFEINPRFSGTTSVRAIAGYNEPDVLIRRDVLGEKIEPHFAYRETAVLRGLMEMDLGGDWICT